MSNGSLTYAPETPAGPAWILAVQPHIAIRVKRIFPRADQARTGLIGLKDTPEVARDLEWLLERHPLDSDPDTLAQLRRRADEHRAREERQLQILTGTRLTGLQEPARTPRDYQVTAADLAYTTGRLLIADDVGLGKTFTSLLLLRDPAALPALVVTLTHLPRQWAREVEKSFPWLKVHIAASGQPVATDADVVILNYHKLWGWADHLAGAVNTVIFDEVQELRRDGTNKYRAAGQIADKALWKVGLSATPVYNYGGEIHTILSILDQEALGSRPEFIREWGAGAYDDKVRVKDPAALGAYLRDEGLLIRRTRKDVHRELPEPVKIVHEVDANPAALEAVKDDVAALARLILTKADTRDQAQEKWRFAGELDWKLRQATGIAKAPYVAEFVKLLLESEDQIVLFGWHRAVYDIWLDLLRDYNPVLYTGSETANQKDTSRQAFMDGRSRVLIMSLRSGAGLDGLQERASVLVLGELDWSPAMHDQCIGRLARDGQDATVAAYYLVTDDGADPVIADVLELKRQQAEPIRDPNAPLLATAQAQTERVKLLAQSILDRTGEPPR